MVLITDNDFGVLPKTILRLIYPKLENGLFTLLRLKTNSIKAIPLCPP